MATRKETRPHKIKQAKKLTTIITLLVFQLCYHYIMYKSFTAEQFKSHLGLPLNYSVEGLLSYGAWDEHKHLDEIQKILNELGVTYKSKMLAGFLCHICELEINGKIYWFTMLYGGAMLSEYTHLACLFGSKKNIHIGSCGGLYPEMNSLDFLIPKWSFGDESTTRIYGREVKDNKHYSNSDLSEKLKSKITIKNKIWDGPIITCQAMIGETWDDIKSWTEQGYYGVEMETSTVFSVSNHFNVPSASLLYVSDNLVKGQVVGDESHIAEKEQREKAKDEVYKASIKTLIE